LPKGKHDLNLPITLENLSTQVLFLVCIAGLFLATQTIIVVLDQLEKKKFGAVLLGTMITPLCTGYPNLVVGLFGQERFQGDLVLKLNMGNNLANTSLVAGLLLLFAGPLFVRPLKGKSKKALAALKAQYLAIFFLWLGTIACFLLSLDGTISRWDSVALVGIYACYQLLAYRKRGKVTKKMKMSWLFMALVVFFLAISTWLIQYSLDALALAMSRVDHLMEGGQLGLFLGLLTVIPESFLLLRLAFKKGSLGLNGLVGDCMVSIPLVVGLSATLTPISTHAIQSFKDSNLLPYLFLLASMTALTVLSFAKKPVPRKVGVLFIGLYLMVWFLTS